MARRPENGAGDKADKGADRGGTKRKRRPAKRRARKVRRIVRRVDAWSVLKFSLLFYLCTFLILMVAGVLLWSAAQSAGTIEGFEGFITDIGGYEFFRFEGDQIFRAAFIGGLVLVLAGSAANVLLSVLFNLISDLTGGIRFVVIEEENVAPPKRRPAPEPAASTGDEAPARPSRPPAISEL